MVDIKEILRNLESQLDAAIKIALKTAKNRDKLEANDFQKIYDIAEQMSWEIVEKINEEEDRDELLVAQILSTVKLMLSTIEIYISDNNIEIADDVENPHESPPETMYM